MNLALFDFDGTITFEDTFVPFLHFATSRSRIALGTVALSPMILAYKAGLLTGTRMRAAAAYVGFRGRREDEVNDLGQHYARTLHRRLRREALERIRWHQAQGDRVVVVSASLRPYLRGWCDEMGVELVCTELEAHRGILTGRYVEGDCTGREKARRVRSRYDLSVYPTIYAYGDTQEDHALLGLAGKRYFRWRELPAVSSAASQ